MRKLSKGKITGIVACSLAAVSLAGVGFATWVVGTRTTTANTDVSISADDVTYDFIKITADFTGSGNDGKICLAGKKESGSVSGPIKYEGDSPVEDLTIIGTFTIEVGNGINLASEYSDLSFSIDNSQSDTHVSNLVDDSNNKLTSARITKPSGGYTYFDCVSQKIDFTNLGAGTKGTDGLTTTYTFTNQTINFSWGSYFTSTSDQASKDPISFYNTYLNQNDINTADNLKNAALELQAMKTKYTEESTGKTISLKMALTPKANSQE